MRTSKSGAAHKFQQRQAAKVHNEDQAAYATKLRQGANIYSLGLFVYYHFLVKGLFLHFLTLLHLPPLGFHCVGGC
jgi:hypothetical protein